MSPSGRSLGAKVVFFVSLLTLLAFAGLFLANFFGQKATAVQQIHESSQRTSALLRMAINGPMVVGDHEGTVEQFDFVSRSFQDVEAYLTDSKGIINYSTEKESVGQGIAQRPGPRAVACRCWRKASPRPGSRGLCSRPTGPTGSLRSSPFPTAPNAVTAMENPGLFSVLWS